MSHDSQLVRAMRRLASTCSLGAMHHLISRFHQQQRCTRYHFFRIEPCGPTCRRPADVQRPNIGVMSMWVPVGAWQSGSRALRGGGGSGPAAWTKSTCSFWSGCHNFSWALSLFSWKASPEADPQANSSPACATRPPCNGLTNLPSSDS